VKTTAKICDRSVLAQIRVLWPTVPLEKLTEQVEDEAVLQAVEEAKGTVDNLADDVASQLDLIGGRPVDQPRSLHSRIIGLLDGKLWFV
jgi:arginine decarboxylase-like protein